MDAPSSEQKVTLNRYTAPQIELTSIKQVSILQQKIETFTGAHLDLSHYVFTKESEPVHTLPPIIWGLIHHKHIKAVTFCDLSQLADTEWKNILLILKQNTALKGIRFNGKLSESTILSLVKASTDEKTKQTFSLEFANTTACSHTFLKALETTVGLLALITKMHTSPAHTKQYCHVLDGPARKGRASIKAFRGTPDLTAETVRDALVLSYKIMHNHLVGGATHGGIICCLSSCVYLPDTQELIVAHRGTTQVYLVDEKGELFPLTTDHDHTSAEECEKNRSPEPNVKIYNLSQGETKVTHVLLCSDGVVKGFSGEKASLEDFMKKHHTKYSADASIPIITKLARDVEKNDDIALIYCPLSSLAGKLAWIADGHFGPVSVKFVQEEFTIFFHRILGNTQPILDRELIGALWHIYSYADRKLHLEDGLNESEIIKLVTFWMKNENELYFDTEQRHFTKNDISLFTLCCARYGYLPELKFLVNRLQKQDLPKTLQTLSKILPAHEQTKAQKLLNLLIDCRICYGYVYGSKNNHFGGIANKFKNKPFRQDMKMLKKLIDNYRQAKSFDDALGILKDFITPSVNASSINYCAHSFLARMININVFHIFWGTFSGPKTEREQAVLKLEKLQLSYKNNQSSEAAKKEYCAESSQQSL